ncbi:MerR family transcriptional regulator [Paracoccus suum]|uniref:MerR family transcriptional regulator n=1 Tax=Paracoccus suum TaxID=2259340 RepID=A0A344PK81_9RHOB|nr:MerR family transcriptional regulator [Paracoccus suum]AXC49786.1 MerR family transcriptional regulator [Paracoccus suum]
MVKSAEAFRSIGEVARLIGVAPHVLRYWEAQFPQLSPVKRADGRRYYRPDDVRLAAGLCVVMRDEGMTARGATRLMADDKGAALRARGADRLAELLAAAPTQSSRKPAPAKQRSADGPAKSPRREATDLPLFPQAKPPKAVLSERFAAAHDGLRRLPNAARHRAALTDLAQQLRARLKAA